jgi:multidrug resistance efflux pump
VRLDAISRGEGILVQVPGTQWEVLQPVKQGEVIARIDDRILLTQLNVVKADLEMVRSKLDEVTEETKFEQIDREVRHEYEARALASFIEQSRLAMLTTKATIAADTIELQGLEQILKMTQDGVDKKAITRLALLTAQKERDVVAARLTSAQETLKQTKGQYERALERNKQHVALPKPEIEKLLGPIHAEMTAKEAQIQQIELQIETLVIKSPLDGVVVAVLRRPGQAVKVGDPIMTIAGNEGKFIVSYVRQSRNLQPQPNMQVDIRPRRVPRHVVVSQIAEIGSALEAVPPHQLRAQSIMEWGLPVRIPIPAGLDLRPGELVDVRIYPYTDMKPIKPAVKSKDADRKDDTT